MKKLVCAAMMVFLIVTCKKSSPDTQTSNTSIIGKWKLSAFQNDTSGNVYWQPTDTLNSYAIFTSDTLIFLTSLENDTDLYKITQPGIFYIYRGLDSFKIVYMLSPTLLTFTNAYCSEACGQRYIRVQ
jgi:hypothetical protein